VARKWQLRRGYTEKCLGYDFRGYTEKYLGYDFRGYQSYVTQKKSE
jgi:hypothetical protein